MSSAPRPAPPVQQPVEQPQPQPAPRPVRVLSIPLAGDGVIPRDERERLWNEMCALVPSQLLEDIRRNFRNKMRDALDKLYNVRRRLLKIADGRNATPGNYLPAVFPKTSGFDLPSCLNNTEEGKAFLEQLNALQTRYSRDVSDWLSTMLKAAHSQYERTASFALIWEEALKAADKDLVAFRCCASETPPTPAEFPEDFLSAADPRRTLVRARYAPALLALAVLLRTEHTEADHNAEHHLRTLLEQERKKREDRQALDIAAQQDKARSVAEISAQAANAAAQEASRPIESRVHKMENDLHSIAGQLEQLVANFATFASGGISDRPADRSAAAPRPTRPPPAAARTPASPRAPAARSPSRGQRPPPARAPAARSPSQGQRPPPAAASATPASRGVGSHTSADPRRSSPPRVQGHRPASPRYSKAAANRREAPPGPSPVTTRSQRARNGRPLHAPRDDSPDRDAYSDPDDFWETPHPRHVRYADADADDEFFTPRRDSRDSSPRQRHSGNAYAALANPAPHATANERAAAEDSRANTSTTQRPRNSRQSPQRFSRGGSARGASRR